MIPAAFAFICAFLPTCTMPEAAPDPESDVVHLLDHVNFRLGRRCSRYFLAGDWDGVAQAYTQVSRFCEAQRIDELLAQLDEAERLTRALPLEFHEGPTGWMGEADLKTIAADRAYYRRYHLDQIRNMSRSWRRLLRQWERAGLSPPPKAIRPQTPPTPWPRPDDDFTVWLWHAERG
jgi:hypothetical protein